MVLVLSTLLHGDVLEQLKTIETGSVGMILTDPPYNIGYKGAEWDKIDNYIDWCRDWLLECCRVLRENGTLIIWHQDLPTISQLMTMIDKDTPLRYSCYGLWHKPNHYKQAWANTNGKCTQRSWFNTIEMFLVFSKIMSANILSIDFAARESTIPVLGATIQLNLSVGGCVDFVLIFDNATFATFSEVYADGKCCKALSLPLLGVGNGSHNLSIAIKSDTAKGTAQVPSAAYVMGSGLAANTAWNGTIRQPFDNISIDNHRMTVASISDNVTANAPKPIGLNIKEQGLKWIINTNTISVKDITDTLPSNPIQAYNDGDNTIYIDFYNPLKSDDLEANIANFEITTVINTTTTKIPILTLEQSQLNQLRTAG